MGVLFIPLVKVCVKYTYISYGLQKKYVAYSHSFIIVQVTFFAVYHRYRLFSEVWKVKNDLIQRCSKKIKKKMEENQNYNKNSYFRYYQSRNSKKNSNCHISGSSSRIQSNFLTILALVLVENSKISKFVFDFFPFWALKGLYSMHIKKFLHV